MVVKVGVDVLRQSQGQKGKQHRDHGRNFQHIFHKLPPLAEVGNVLRCVGRAGGCSARAFTILVFAGVALMSI
jgi:hypothetical protein